MEEVVTRGAAVSRLVAVRAGEREGTCGRRRCGCLRRRLRHGGESTGLRASHHWHDGWRCRPQKVSTDRVDHLTCDLLTLTHDPVLSLTPVHLCLVQKPCHHAVGRRRQQQNQNQRQHQLRPRVVTRGGRQQLLLPLRSPRSPAQRQQLATLCWPPPSSTPTNRGELDCSAGRTFARLLPQLPALVAPRIRCLWQRMPSTMI